MIWEKGSFKFQIYWDSRMQLFGKTKSILDVYHNPNINLYNIYITFYHKFKVCELFHDWYICGLMTFWCCTNRYPTKWQYKYPLLQGCKEIESPCDLMSPPPQYKLIGCHRINGMTLIRVDDMYNVPPLSWIGTLDISLLRPYNIWQGCQKNWNMKCIAFIACII